MASAAAAINGRIYAIGGYAADGPSNANQEYDPATDTWATKSSTGFPARNALAAAAVNGRIYAIGGYTGSYSNANQEYDPATDTWTTKSSTGLTARYGLAATAVNGMIYAIGGYIGSSDGTGGYTGSSHSNANQELTVSQLRLYVHVKQ